MSRTRSRAIKVTSAAVAVAAPSAALVLGSTGTASAGACPQPPYRSGANVVAESFCTAPNSTVFLEVSNDRVHWKVLSHYTDPVGTQGPIFTKAPCVAGGHYYQSVWQSDFFKGGSDAYAPRFFTC
jgi:hypothetical protein